MIGISTRQDKLYSMARGLTEAGEPPVKSQIMPSNSSRVAALTGRLIRSVAISDGKAKTSLRFWPR